MKRIKKILKIVIGAIVFLTLPTLLLYGYLYYKYNEELPIGREGKEADALANKMLDALNHQAYDTTTYLEWTFKKRHHFKWNKAENTCEVYWKNYKVNLNFDDPSKNTAYKGDLKIEAVEAEKLVKKATNYFNNDSFWLVAPYKIFDSGTKRSLVTLDNDEKALLVTYTKGGSSPGDSYLWQLDETGKPKNFKMWTSILPIDGLEASWSDWTTTETGTLLPTFHKMMFLGIEIEGIKTIPDSGQTYYYPNNPTYKNSKNKIDIPLDSLSYFNELLDTLKSLSCTHKTPIINYNDEKSNFKLALPFIHCDGSIGCYKRRNVIELRKDSLFFHTRKLTIDSLPKYLEKHLLNNGKNPMFSQNTNNAIFQIGNLGIKSNINDLKTILIQLSKEYNDINTKHQDSLLLNIQFSNLNN